MCVDLDGTLIAADTLWESLLALREQKPLGLLLLPFWLLRGRAFLKGKLAQATQIDAEHLPYRESVLQTIEELKGAGAARVVLATASHVTLAREVARHLGIFDEVMASEGGVNLKGKAKAAALQERFGNDFLYIGDSAADLAVWAVARQAVVVGSKALALRAAAVTDVQRVVGVEAAGWKVYWKALRPSHWSKNVLLLLPLLLAHRWAAADWARTVLGIFLFGLAASGIYVLNDLLDLPSDRKHPWKRLRPFAAGRISVVRGVALSVPSWPARSAWAGSGWDTDLRLLWPSIARSPAYSLILKRKPLIDVFVLTGFYGVRIVTGALISHIRLSHWFLVFSMSSSSASHWPSATANSCMPGNYWSWESPAEGTAPRLATNFNHGCGQCICCHYRIQLLYLQPGGGGSISASWTAVTDLSSIALLAVASVVKSRTRRVDGGSGYAGNARLDELQGWLCVSVVHSAYIRMAVIQNWPGGAAWGSVNA